MKERRLSLKFVLTLICEKKAPIQPSLDPRMVCLRQASDCGAGNYKSAEPKQGGQVSCSRVRDLCAAEPFPPDTVEGEAPRARGVRTAGTSCPKQTKETERETDSTYGVLEVRLQVGNGKAQAGWSRS